ncbi:MAG: prephenate dehydrogenase/arogenate dehydrogenase family protein [archaeon]|nr:prephenate dehydrogenase/arogenate dehydrogenase family protein [archaeon]MCP8313271.1 prephenate dehydrogenase/arogenate dehydrogenase family protein [archaeon]MCP8319476.1 prephenate dehydrogenase/arogenate dehydrogenase family protein [archaeon]
MKIAIIGGAGNMGKWFCNFFLKQGYEVIVSGRIRQKLIDLSKEIPVKVAENNIEAVKKADIIMISVLLQNFEDVVREFAPYIKKNQIVLDITSVKEIPVDIMHRYIKKGTILGTHPVFGPGAKDTNQNFVLTPSNEKEEKYARELETWLEERGFKVSIMSPRKHDELMAVILGFSHFVGLTVGDTWLDLNFRELEKISGTSFKTLFNLVENVVNTDPEFYSVLQMSLPNVDKVESLFQRKIEKWLNIIRNKDKEKFVKEMIALRKKLEESRRYSQA